MSTNWIDPVSIEPNLNLKLNVKIQKNLDKLGISELFPMQKTCIQTIQTGLHDVCVSAATGSGKTLAYCIPIVTKLMHRIVPKGEKMN